MGYHIILIANQTFDDLEPLTDPAPTASFLKETVTNAWKDDPDVTVAGPFIDKGSGDVLTAVVTALKTARNDDLVLIYYFGHLVFDELFGPALAFSGGLPTRRHLGFREIEHQMTSTSRVLLLLDTPVKSIPQMTDSFRKNNYVVAEFNKVDKGFFVLTAGSAQEGRREETFQGQLIQRFVDAMKAFTPDRALTLKTLTEQLGTVLSDNDIEPVVYAKDRAADLLVRAKRLPWDEARPITPWQELTREQNACLVHMCPVYLLDSKFFFLDWNAAFEEIIAKPLGLVRGQHAGRFLVQLDNWAQVEKHSHEQFRGADPESPAEKQEEEKCEEEKRIRPWLPLADHEAFEYRSPEFHLIVFEKLATQIRESDGACKSWSVGLSVSFIQRRQEFWERIKKLASDELLWSRYADCYDEIIGAYPKYRELIEFVAKKVDGKTEVLDVGAGTGNTTIKLLEVGGEKRHVTSLELNRVMVTRMSYKVRTLQDGDGGYSSRVTLYQGDALTTVKHWIQLGKSEQTRNLSKRFDACVMVNVLFTLDDPRAYLRAIYEVLEPGGILCLSTPRTGTSIKNLFEENIKPYYEKNETLWPQKEAAYLAAYERNREFEHLAVRDSIEAILTYVREAGFVRIEYEDNMYCDCVVVVWAMKPEPGEVER